METVNTIFIWGIKRNESSFPYGYSQLEMGIVTSPYGNGESPFPYGESKNMAPHFHMGIPIWKRGLMHPHMEMGNACFHMGNQENDSLFPYRDLHMEMGIDTSQYGNGESLFPYDESKNTAPHFHMGILIWKQGLTHPHMEIGNAHFHMGNYNK
jgi:hypothetical protein